MERTIRILPPGFDQPVPSSSIVRDADPPVVFTPDLQPGERVTFNGPDGGPWEAVGVDQAATPRPRAPDAAPPAHPKPAPAGGGGGGGGPGTVASVLGPLGPTDFQFTRFTEYFTSQFVGAPALVRYLLSDIGRIDPLGRPEEGRTLWWFLAHLDPGATQISSRRETLQQLLKQVRGNPAAGAVLLRQGQTWLAEAKSLLNSSEEWTRISEHAGEAEKTAYVAGRAALLRMIAAAKSGLTHWRSESDFIGNEYFMARHVNGDELTRSELGKNYQTLDDDIIGIAAPLAKRLEQFGDTPLPRPEVEVATPRPSWKPAHALGEAEMKRVAKRSAGPLAELLKKSVEELSAVLSKAKLEPVAMPEGMIGSKALLIDGEGPFENGVALIFERFGGLFGYAVPKGAGFKFTGSEPPADRDDARIERAKSSAHAVCGQLQLIWEAQRSSTTEAQRSKSEGGFEEFFAGAQYKPVPVPPGQGGDYALEVLGPDRAKVLDGQLTLVFNDDGSMVDYLWDTRGKRLSYADLPKPPAAEPLVEKTKPSPVALGKYSLQADIRESLSKQRFVGAGRQSSTTIYEGRPAGARKMELEVLGLDDQGVLLARLDGREFRLDPNKDGFMGCGSFKLARPEYISTCRGRSGYSAEYCNTAVLRLEPKGDGFTASLYWSVNPDADSHKSWRTGDLALGNPRS